jgi:hypothetical protein
VRSVPRSRYLSVGASFLNDTPTSCSSPSVGPPPCRRLEEEPAGGGDVDVRIVLDTAEEAAYGRIRDRLVRMWHDFDSLSRWMY